MGIFDVRMSELPHNNEKEGQIKLVFPKVVEVLPSTTGIPLPLTPINVKKLELRLLDGDLGVGKCSKCLKSGEIVAVHVLRHLSFCVNFLKKDKEFVPNTI